VRDFAPGDRVIGWTGWGAAREKIAAGAAQLVKLPQNLDFERGAGLTKACGSAACAAAVAAVRLGRTGRKVTVTVPGFFTAVAPPGAREMPLYPACCGCGRERDDLADFYAEPPTQPRHFAGLIE